MSFKTNQIRNVVLAGHSGSGKTSLLDQILFNTKIIKVAESPESGKTVSDYTPEEIQKKFSMYTTLNHFFWKEMKFNLFDTPGLPGFIGDVVCGFRAAECAIMVIDAKNSVQIETTKLWRRLNKRMMPRVAFINKLDIERSDFHQVMEDLKSRFKRICVPIVIPMGEGAEFKGIINLIEMKAYSVHPAAAEDVASEIPKEFVDEANSMRETMIELAAEGDDALIEKYFNDGTLSEEEIIQGLTLGMINNRVVPVLAGSASLNNGIASLLNFICTAAPSPVDIHEVAFKDATERIEVPINNTGNMSAFAFKTKYDPFLGKLNFVKVITGVLKPEMEITNTTVSKKEKIHKLYSMQGSKLKEIDALEAGDIGVITKSQTIQANDTIIYDSDHQTDFTYHWLRLPHPVHSLAISSGSKKDEDKMLESLHRIAEEDHTFTVGYKVDTKETVVSGMGEVHLSTILKRVTDKQKIEIETKTPRVAYRETITGKAETEYVHKKQTGGHGQYAKIVMQMEATTDGSDYEFVNAIKGGSISKGYMPGIEKGFHESMTEGFLAGFPVTGIKFTILDGREHPVDSSEMAFKLAAKGGFKDAIAKAKPILLEPLMKLFVFTEENYLGDILSDISSKRGRVLSQDLLGGGITEVIAEVPQGELLKYTIDLKSLTSDTGSFEMEFSGYQPVSDKLKQQIIADYEAHKEEH